MFTKILIANRGEIACRVIQTARKMGIKTVAVYSDADKDARHVELADEAVHIGPAPSRDSYLQGDKIIAAAKQTGAQAIHPGYGFLSENAGFAKRVEEEGLVFIGPKHYSIAAMGDKIESKKLAGAAGVNCIPGVNDAIETAEKAVEIAQGIGYPVMIKASAGGGGKGLRVAFNDKEALEGFTSCRNEARNSFGDDRVFIEKFVEEPRHIEIQLIGDSHGNVIYLNERECSIQRRHQKVIEEAPSPFISEATRKAMGEQAVALAKAVKYESAGTVEFVVGKDQSFYFLEMNTRLQVEHPVTECITGLDLVELMIRVAAGEKLPLAQKDVKREGWAIECRINAEDPFRNFLPSTGRLVRFQPPRQDMFAAETAQLFGVRVDTGVQDGGEIPMFYDSMIAKLIVHGTDRLDAIAKMREALNSFVIRGVSSNIPFQAALLAHPKFVAGDFNTGFIAENYAQGFRAEDVPHDDAGFLVALAAYVNRRLLGRAAGISGQLPGHGVTVAEEFVVVGLGEAGKNIHEAVTVRDFQAESGSSAIEAGGKRYEICSRWHLGGARIRGTVNGQPFAAQVERGVGRNPLAIRIAHNGTRLDTLVLSPRAAQLHALMPYKAPPDMSRFVLSPMPGLLVEVAVQPGQKVQAGERVAVIEAMKMENVLFATADGVVGKVLAAKGESLSVDQPIVEFV
ncbi:MULTISPECIES: acetyl/propionyl/methylcrotonyl-CoA carboxylase subunit alpha [unclassified Polaromonas]|jgi:propionyl-CoA carboxylase alpha chain|uniref:acetyl-CoA carboxylase biotin carboxylase subunit n=1 Tax=unclassified Polaromonas TaxID=2638319 RepID=UPI000BD762FD|nr:MULTISPECIES: acetyl/propionyl/methylcrotonyl-CoA carboxylase subunit alpha [unclassified Polaromonas]OYY39049.1 MAG: acetyl/propionyl-CoA carboxylase subunit alpha [Polaromonas sp. 35-63-35]OYZ21914.1 MAG: acetyl/propionyl-CoA carboxylase subunit alpha [Polaromonas sp. 16-63-31]OYZ80352.1 MAG: acetyl/propionyl-CoA carboxylase subunit alpha [Polaromonas sp. 24-63-21]OZA51415.1 MAG: acetyl/propionyl-CoA carboxylase subunit alpha [Polaromonas sp. 17-63-33]OZA90113.1 MAG: acetyl/propionyl-CoA 